MSMFIYTSFGTVVAVIGLLIVEIGSNRFGRNYTFYCMLAVVYFGLLVASFFAEPADFFYKLGWLLGMLTMVGLGFLRRRITSRGS